MLDDNLMGVVVAMMPSARSVIVSDFIIVDVV